MYVCMFVCVYVCTYVWRGDGPAPPKGGGSREGRKKPGLFFISFYFIFACKCHMSPVRVCGGTVPCVVWSLPVHEPYIESLGGRVVGAARRRVSGRRDVRSGGCWGMHSAIVALLRCFSVSLVRLCAVGVRLRILRILSRPKAVLLARESGWKPWVYACYTRALARVAIRAYKRRVRTVRRSGGRVIPWTHSNCVGGDVIRGSGQVNRMLRWTSECGEWRRWKVEM